MTRPRWPQAAIAVAALLAGCGGGSPLDNAPAIANPAGSGSGAKLSFAYFQRCVEPVLQTPIAGPAGTNACASSGCHDSRTGTGGALRIVQAAPPVDLGDAALTTDAIRATDIYKNFYSAQGVSVPGSPEQSRLLDKPLLLGVLHGGGLIFANADDPDVQRLRYWISRPMPDGQDEFGSAAASLFTPPDPITGACKVP